MASPSETSDLEVDLLDPRVALRRLQPPGVALVLDVLEQAVELGRELRLDHHAVAAHVDDVVDVLDVDGALVDARAARRARPEHVLVDHRVVVLAAADQRAGVRVLHRLRVRADLDRHGHGRLAGARVPRYRGLLLAARYGACSEQVVAQVHDQQLRRERLLGVPRGALRLASAALGAREEVEVALPGEVLDRRRGRRSRRRPGPRSRSGRGRSTSAAAGRGRWGAGRTAR